MDNPTVSLPPKRYEDPSLPIFDSIRHYPWFGKLEKRRLKIVKLKEAARIVRQECIPAGKAAAQFGLNRRELWGYLDFHNKLRLYEEPNTQMHHALNSAYGSYCARRGGRSFSWCLKEAARLYGVNPRQLIEKWETDPMFVPKN